MSAVYVVGAGLAGLSAAVRLAKAGANITLLEAAPHAGGRCRSFYDPQLDAVIDNGRHLMLSGNDEVRAYLDLIGAADEVFALDRARFDFFDARTQERWFVDFGQGQGRLGLLKALMRKSGRPPGVKAATIVADLGRLKRAGAEVTVADCVASSSAFASFWRPMCVSVLNTLPDTASAQALHQVLAATVLKGGELARPLLTRSNLGAALIDPALACLKDLGATVRLGTRVKALDMQNGRVAGLDLTNGVDILGANDAVVLAVPHFAASELLPSVSPPSESHAILNVHYHLEDDTSAPPLTGLVNARAEWAFVHGRIASLTISAADAWMDKDSDAIAHELWPEAAAALGVAVGQTTPPYRVIKERRATFAQTPANQGLRPGAETTYRNLVLAGDWTSTGLPATIEGAVKSGRFAAEALLSRA